MTKVEVGKTYKFRINSNSLHTEVIYDRDRGSILYNIFLIDSNGNDITHLKSDFITAKVCAINEQDEYYDLTVQIIDLYD
jgi:hypothetical protein